MKKYIINEKEYELIENYKDAFEYDIVKEKATEYFDNFDYIVGDWSYGKLRLKGFCDVKNKNLKDYNNYKNINDYIQKECAYDCKWFSLKKL